MRRRAIGSTTLGVTRNERRYRGSDERYTPPWLLERVEAFFGAGWFDPCPRGYGKAPEVNGLAAPWRGRVYCNPPYSRMAPWVAKFTAETFEEGLFLTLAYTDTKWFQPLFALPILFPRGRICFIGPDGRTMNRPPFGSALIYRGPRLKAFCDAFGDLGNIVIPAPQQARPAHLWMEAAS